MSLSGVVGGASPGVQGFDANTILSSRAANAMREAGFAFCVRYVSRGLGQQRGDLTAVEAERILDAGLALMAVQHVEAEGWRPSLELGKTYGSHAAANAAEVGFPAGVNVWLDLEGVNHQVSARGCHCLLQCLASGGRGGGLCAWHLRRRQCHPDR